MINPLQQSEQTLHVSTPLIQHIIGIARFGEIDDPSRTIDFGVDGLCGDELANVLLRLVFGEIEELGEPGHLDACIILGNDTDVVLNDALAEILPSLKSLGILSIFVVAEDVVRGEVRCELFGDDRPSHQLG